MVESERPEFRGGFRPPFLSITSLHLELLSRKLRSSLVTLKGALPVRNSDPPTTCCVTLGK